MIFSVWLIIFGLIVFFIVRRKEQKFSSQEKEWFLQLALSKEDGVSQLFMLLSFFFFSITLLAFNKDLGDPLSWQTILFIVSVAGLVGVYYFRAMYVLIFSLIGITFWWGVQTTGWLENKDIKLSVILTGIMFIGLLFYVLGHLHEKEIKFKRLALVYFVFGIVIVTGGLFFLSTKMGLGVLGYITKGKLFFGSWQATLSLVILTTSIIGVSFYSASKGLISVFEILAVLILMALFGFITLLPEQNMFVQPIGRSSFYIQGELSGIGVFWALIFNLAVFFELVGLIFSGYLRKESWLINLGAFFLSLLIIIKYFDWFFTFLNKSIFFIGAGILLFAVGWFMEKGRRYMITGIKPKSKQVSQQFSK